MMSNPATDPTPAKPDGATARRFGWRTITSCIVVVSLAIATAILVWSPSVAYGPPEASQVELIVAPGLSVELLPSDQKIAGLRFSAFDVSPKGAVVVSTGRRLFDMATGEPLLESGVTVRSFAFVEQTLALTDEDGNVGFLEAGRFRSVGTPPVRFPWLAASSEHTRLFLVRHDFDESGETPALVEMREGSVPEILTGSSDPVEAVGADSTQTYFSVRNALFQIVATGRPSLLFVMPDTTPTPFITGLAVAGTAVYLATESAVYTLEGGVAVPLVIGVGGAIRIVRGSLYVLDRNRGRVYRIIVSERGDR